MALTSCVERSNSIRQVAGILTMATIGVSVTNGLGRHLYYLSIEQLEVIFKWVWLGQIFWTATATFTRVSVALFLLRMFQVVKIWRWSLYALACMTLASGIFGLVFLLAAGQPIAANWDLLVQATCWPSVKVIAVTYDYISGGICSARHLSASIGG